MLGGDRWSHFRKAILYVQSMNEGDVSVTHMQAGFDYVIQAFVACVSTCLCLHLMGIACVFFFCCPASPISSAPSGDHLLLLAAGAVACCVSISTPEHTKEVEIFTRRSTGGCRKRYLNTTDAIEIVVAGRQK